MPFAGKADVVIDPAPTPPTITCGDETHDGIDNQDLYDALREWEDDIANIDLVRIVDAAEASMTDGSGKEGIGGGATRPITIVINAAWVVQAGDHTSSPLDIFQFTGGTLISDEEAAGDPSPRTPFQAASGVTTYRSVLGQEGKFTSSDTLETAMIALQASFDTAEGRDLGQHITEDTLGKVIIRDTVNLRRWEGDAWEDVARTIPYGTNPDGGLQVVDTLIEVAYS